MPLYGVIALVAVMSCEDAVQTKVQEIVVILTLLPLLLVVYGWELLKRKLKVGPQQPEKPRDDTE